MKRSFLTVIMAFLLLVATSCGENPYQSPKTTLESARSALKNDEWNDLYNHFHPELRAEKVIEWRKQLSSLLESNKNTAGIGPEDVEALSNRQVFRTYLESLSRSPRVNQVLNRYENAEYDLSRSESGRVTASIESDGSVPYTEVVLTTDGSRWLIRNLNR